MSDTSPSAVPSAPDLPGLESERDRIRTQLDFTGGSGADADAWLAERRTRWIIGTPDEAAERIGLLADAGVQRIMLQDFLPRDLDMVRLMGRLVA